MGHYDRTQPVAGRRPEWPTAGRLPAGRLLGQLTNDTKPEDWAKYQELVIVPDGVLWYLPFEALPVPVDGGATSPLLSQIPIRYAPTLSLAAPDERGMRPVARTAVVAGKLLPRDDDALAKAGVDAIVAGAARQ